MADQRFEVRLTEGAEGDLKAIHTWLAEHRSEEDADTLLESFLEKVATLERFPSRGGIPKELGALGIREFRQILMSPYRLIYRVIGDTVFILVIADGRRDMQALLEHRLLNR
ncbi:plasmid stabilization system protein ParE [Hephaestia caeni]|uniref:Plasmid stabilization system protein ParE n=1 Tax=Hephaestia caeni TaxID=645617 RepID=A0A397PEU3_9SPHN|nr:type II toxin-antitoxin system RelE/ParE family toxin [Hephaestia caeni]RIA44674.1 plasmid stabilization system protein ParE [Hephaestia caeni]